MTPADLSEAQRLAREWANARRLASLRGLHVAPAVGDDALPILIRPRVVSLVRWNPFRNDGRNEGNAHRRSS